MLDFIAILGNLLLFALVFGMSATVEVSDIRAQLSNTRALLTGMFCQFVALPILGFLTVKFLRLDPAIGITLLVVTSSPGGSYSNWWCSLFNASLALSVSMTAISTLLSVFFLPMNLLLFTKYSYEADVLHNLDWISLFVALSIVIMAIGMGLYCSSTFHKSRKLHKAANALGNTAGLLLVLFSATMTNTGGGDSKIWSREWSFYVAVIIPCAGGLFLATLLASVLRLRPPERVTVGIECCYQNVGIATSVALAMFQGEDLNRAMGVPFFYGVVEAVLVGFYCVICWKANWTKAPADAPLWHVIVTSYEVEEAEKQDLLGVEVGISDSGTDGDMKKQPSSSAEYFDGSFLTTYFDLAWLTAVKEEQIKTEEKSTELEVSKKLSANV
jgi:predicted Na+-dependent transporter